MKRKLPFLLGILAAIVLIAASTFFWRDVLELWHLSRFRVSDPATREAAVSALVAMRSPRAAIAFVKLAKADREGPGEACAKRVIQVLDDAAFERLPRFLRSEEDDVRVLLVESAKHAGVAANRLLPIFRGALRSANPSLRRWAAEEIGAVGTDAAALAPEIRTMLTDPSDLVRLWAEIALWKIAPDASGPPDPESLTAGE